MKGFAAAQRAYDAQLPPEWPEYEDDCEGEECGECEACSAARKAAYDEALAEYKYDWRKEEGR